LKDYFELQDDIASKIATAMDVKLVSGEGARLWHKNIPNDLQFIEKYFEGWAYVYQYTKEANMKLRQINKELMDLAPAFYDPYVGLAWNHVMDVYLGMSRSPDESLEEAIKLCKEAMTLDESQDMPPPCPWSYLCPKRGIRQSHSRG
jgi:hypothetical protein